MWWQILVGTVIGMVIGGGVYSWGWNNGVKWARMENSHEKYLAAMRSDSNDE